MVAPSVDPGVPHFFATLSMMLRIVRDLVQITHFREFI